jgi:hypothetical protein
MIGEVLECAVGRRAQVLTGYTISARRFPPSTIRIGILVEVAVALDIVRTELPKAKRLLDTSS